MHRDLPLRMRAYALRAAAAGAAAAAAEARQLLALGGGALPRVRQPERGGGGRLQRDAARRHVGGAALHQPAARGLARGRLPPLAAVEVGLQEDALRLGAGACVRAACMVCAWDMHGLCIGYAWGLHGTCMAPACVWVRYAQMPRLRGRSIFRITTRGFTPLDFDYSDERGADDSNSAAAAKAAAAAEAAVAADAAAAAVAASPPPQRRLDSPARLPASVGRKPLQEIVDVAEFEAEVLRLAADRTIQL